MFYFAALVAASAALTGCSSDDDLSAAQPAVSTGYPMYVSASAGDETRGTDLESSTFNAFTMYSTIPTTKNSKWATGIAFGKSDGSWSAGTEDVSFPNTNTYTFYGVSDAGNIVKENNNPVIGSVTPESFNFTYQIPTDYAAQKDLLVGKTTGSGSDGKVNFKGDNKFTHALALVSKVSIRANVTKIAELLDMDASDLTTAYEYKVGGSMAICGAMTQGKYTFGTTTTTTGWTDLSNAGEFNIPISASAFHNFNDDWYEIPFSEGDDGLYLLPQTFDGELADNGDGSYTLTGAYIKVDLQVYNKVDGSYSLHKWSPSGGSSAGGTSDSDEDSEENGFRPFYVPLSFEIEPNKTYAIRIDLTRGVYLSNEDQTTLYPLFDGMDVVIN